MNALSMIEQGQLIKALRLLTKSKDKDKSREATAYLGRLAHISAHKKKGIVNEQDYILEINRVRDATLNLIADDYDN